METSGASAGLATMAFPGLIEGGLAEEGCRGVNVILFGGSIASRLFQPRTAGSGPPGGHRGRGARTLDDLIRSQGNQPMARIRAAPFGVCLSSLSPNQSLTLGVNSYTLRRQQPRPGLPGPIRSNQHGREPQETPANRRFHGETL